MTTARLMLAGGVGRLVRRPSVVLFDPTGQNQDVANRFDAADSDSEAVDGLKQYLIESGFTAAPLVVVRWGQAELDLLVFGAVEVHTSAIAAPMVSGAGSSTWVERTLGAIELDAAPKIEVWSGEAADPTTNLGLGVVACAGFRMSLDLAGLGDLAGLSELVDIEDSVAAPLVAAMADIAEVADVAEVVEVAEPTVFEPQAAPSPAPAPTDGIETVEPVIEPVAEADPFTGNATTRATPPAPAPAPIAAAAPAPSFDPDESLTEAAPDEAVADPFAGAGQSEAPRAGLIEAAHCGKGHANPPRSSQCYVCGDSLLEDQSLGLIEQPTVGRITFVSGQSLPLERPVMMGRKPEAQAAGAHPVLIDHVEVSRSHALVTIEGWTVLITDKGSRNGTWVTPANDPMPVRLGEGVPHVLEHGTVVYLGAPEVSFTYYFDAE